MPLGLRRPVAKMRPLPLAMSISQMAARPTSADMPFSATLLLEPTVAYSLLPSALAMMFLVQWWFSVPPGRSVTFTGAAVICVWPVTYGTLTMPSVLAMNNSLPTSTMPNGELSPVRKAVFTSATPSPLVSRSKVMRLALGTPAPARFISSFIATPLMPLPSSGLGGALVSATSTSPLGST